MAWKLSRSRADDLLPGGLRALPPVLEVLVARAPGDVVDRPGAALPGVGRRRVIRPVHVSLAAVEAELAVAERREAEHVGEQRVVCRGFLGVGARRFDA
jgi:hypothetical protein